jgi:dihydrofolate reductase
MRRATSIPDFALIAAVADNGVIGARGGMPWRLSTDLRRFKRLTLGKPVIMGRATFESLGRPLPDRRNIVVTRQAGYAAAGAETAPSLEAALALAAGGEGGSRRPAPGPEGEAGTGGEIMVIGGGEIFAQAIGRAGRLYVTHVHAAPEGDAHFPAIDPATWRAVETEEVPAGPRDSFPTTFTIYDRLGSPVRAGG